MTNANLEKRRNKVQSVNHNSSAGNVGVPKVPASFQGDQLISASFAPMSVTFSAIEDSLIKYPQCDPMHTEVNMTYFLLTSQVLYLSLEKMHL